MNVRAALAHIIGDFVQSIGICLVAITITISQHFDGPQLNFLDPCCTFVFSIIVAYTGYGVFVDCIYVLMEATPNYFDVDEFRTILLSIPEVADVHDLHIWSLTSGKPLLTAHLLTEIDAVKALRKASRLCRKYGIYHSTIQVEWSNDMKSPLFVNCENNLHSQEH